MANNNNNNNNNNNVWRLLLHRAGKATQCMFSETLCTSRAIYCHHARYTGVQVGHRCHQGHSEWRSQNGPCVQVKQRWHRLPNCHTLGYHRRRREKWFKLGQHKKVKVYNRKGGRERERVIWFYIIKIKENINRSYVRVLQYQIIDFGLFHL